MGFSCIKRLRECANGDGAQRVAVGPSMNLTQEDLAWAAGQTTEDSTC